MRGGADEKATGRKARPEAAGLPANVLAFIWRQAPAGHAKLFALVLALLPFNYASLELPRLIVNGVTAAMADDVPPLLALDIALPDWLGGATLWQFAGFRVSAFGLLLGLSATLLALQLIQQHISRLIEMNKARLGERILTRLRRALFDVIQRLKPEAPMRSRALETGNMLRFEVGPIGPFSGMAFAQPLKSVGLIFSAVLLILTQNQLLGGLALAILVLNYLLLGIQRRDNSRKLNAYQRAAVALGKKVAEAIDALPLTHGFATSPRERAEVDAHLGRVSHASLELKRQNAIDRALNLMMSDFPTLAFYFAGGWLALSGALDIGQLVAVVAAYGQIPEPLKEVIDWDERRVVAQVRYDFARHYLETREVWPAGGQDPEAAAGLAFDGALKVSGLAVTDPAGRALLDEVSFEAPAGCALALAGPDGGGKHAVARVLGRAISQYSGAVRLGGHDLAIAPEALLGRNAAYAGGEPIVLPASLAGNLRAALRHAPDAGAPEGEADDAPLLDALAAAGLADLTARLGFERRLDPAEHGALCARIVGLRAEVADAVARRAAAAGRGRTLMEPFRLGVFNRWMSLAENMLFAAPLADHKGASSLLADPALRGPLDRLGVTDDLLALGTTILKVLVELAGGPEGLAALDAKGLVRAGEAEGFAALAGRAGAAGSPADEALLLRLAGRYCEPRHRLGLIDPTWQTRAQAARAWFAALKEISGIPLARYDPDAFCPALPVRDNLLFGRIAADQAGAQSLVDEAIRETLEAASLLGDIERLGLATRLGEGGVPLSAAERGKLTLARCLVARPAILVVDDALAPVPAPERASILAHVLAARAGTTTVAVLDADDPVAPFSRVVTLEHGQVSRVEDRPAPDAPSSASPGP